jgi:hypothetical protein
MLNLGNQKLNACSDTLSAHFQTARRSHFVSARRWLPLPTCHQASGPGDRSGAVERGAGNSPRRLSVMLSNGKVVAIIAIVSAILGVVGMNLKKWYKVIQKYTVGNGRSARAPYDHDES